MSDLLPSELKCNLKPHEQAIIARQIQNARKANERRKEAQKLRLSGALGGVFADAQQLVKSQANWGERPAETAKCEQCRDQGYLMPPVTAKNMLNRRAYPCPDCGDAQKAHHRAEVLREIRHRWPCKWHLIELGAKPIRFGHVDAIKGLDGKQRDLAKNTLNKALRLAQEFAQELEPGAILSFDGKAGTSKTHMLAKIYRWCVLVKKLTCIFVTGRQLQAVLTDFRKGSDGGAALYEKKADLIACDILLIDEVDKIALKEGFGWTESELLDILESRMNRGRPTVLAGNELHRLAEHTRSRCSGRNSYVIDMSSVPDGRPFFQGARGSNKWIKRALKG